MEFKDYFFAVMCAFFLSTLNAEAQDWANLKRYQSENDSISQLSGKEFPVVFMGNSITQQWKEKDPHFFGDHAYLDRGISGQTTPQMLIRFRQDVVSLHPKAVVILAGTNDIAGNTGPSTLEMIMNNLMSMTEIAKANGIKVILCSLLPATEYPWRKGMEPAVKIPQLNKMIKSYCVENNIFYLDYFDKMNDGKNGMIAEYTTDGVHCTLAGYKVMEALVVPAIEKVINEQ